MEKRKFTLADRIMRLVPAVGCVASVTLLVHFAIDGFGHGDRFHNDLGKVFFGYHVAKMAAAVDITTIVVLSVIAWGYRKQRHQRLPGLAIGIAGVLALMCATPIVTMIAFDVGRARAFNAIECERVCAEADHLWHDAQEYRDNPQPPFSMQGDQIIVDVNDAAFQTAAPYIASLHAKAVIVEQHYVVIAMIAGGTVAQDEGLLVMIGDGSNPALNMINTSPPFMRPTPSCPMVRFNTDSYASVVSYINQAKQSPVPSAHEGTNN